MVLNKKTLITFVYFERADKYQLYFDNLNFFQKIGVIPNENYHFNFVIHGQSALKHIVSQHNVSIINGHNKGYDFGGYKQSIDSICIDEFDYFIFINDTCRGPFIPDYIPSEITWVDMFLNKINNKVKIVGPTSWTADGSDYTRKILKSPDKQNKHIQSYCFGVDRIALKILLDNQKFDSIGKNRDEVVLDHEIGCSQCLIRNGYEIESFQLSKFGNKSHESVNKIGRYFGTTINPLEIMFTKTNRIFDVTTKNYCSWILQK